MRRLNNRSRDYTAPAIEDFKYLAQALHCFALRDWLATTGHAPKLALDPVVPVYPWEVSGW